VTAKRIAFRFLFLYLSLFVLTIPFGGFEDTRFRWMLCLACAALAAVAAVVVPALDRDERLSTGFRLLLRFSLAIAMISSGIPRVIPVQMPAPLPSDLLQRLGELTPMRLLWTFLGASPIFQSFTGFAGLLGGVLLLVPRTTLAGALICGANLTMAVTLSLCYDLPFKLYLFHLLFMSVLLIAPDLPRLANLFLLNRTVEPAETPPLSARGRRVQTLLLLLCLIVSGWSLLDAVRRYRRLNPPKPPLYGVWTVEDLAVENGGAGVKPWRWVIFEDPGALDVALRTGGRRRYALGLDLEKRTMVLDHQGAFSFSEPETDVLVLDGRLDGYRTRARLRRMILTASWFHWLFEPEDE
jgi:hypothetical protein